MGYPIAIFRHLRHGGKGTSATKNGRILAFKDGWQLTELRFLY